jgi:hypothetical protein
MSAKRDWSAAFAKGASGVRPTLGGLALKLGLAVAMAAALALGSDHPAATFSVLLESICTAMAGFSLMLALLRRETVRLRVYGYWHEALALGAAGLAVHLALRTLS